MHHLLRYLAPGILLSSFSLGCTNSVTNSSPTGNENNPQAASPTSTSASPTQVARTPAKQEGNAEPSPTVARETPKEPPVIRTEVEEEKVVPPEKDPPIPESFKPLKKDKGLYFEKTADGKRRVHLLAEVCLREGPLEVLLCRENSKEHESILRTDLDGREIHTALIAAGAKFGSTVKFVPEYKPATGDIIKVSLTYYKEGKLLTKPAQSWIHQMRTKKDMAHDWVFAGSRFFKDPDDPEKLPFYCANNGELISIANFPDSMLDLPVKSSKEEAQLGFAATTDRIPPLKTKVIVTLEPVAAEKK